MKSVFALFVLLAAPALQAACPPLPDAAQFAQRAEADDEWLGRYAFARTLKCGWDAARPAVVHALQAAQEGGRDRFYEDALFVGYLHPKDMVAAYVEEADELDDDPWLRPMKLRPGEHARAVLHIEAAIPEFFTLLTGYAPGDAAFDRHVQVALAAHELRSGDIPAARARLDRLDATARAPASAAAGNDVAEFVSGLRAALAPMSPAEPDAADWVLDRTGTRPSRRCGLEQLASGVHPAGLRAEMLRSQGDIAGAIAVLLRNEWRGPQESGISHMTSLLPLLRQRYSARALREGWRDAEGSIRTGGERPGFLLYGVDLPLPRAVRVIDPADPSRVIEQPLHRDEAITYLREWRVFEALFPDGLSR